jgi:hypothetical protein
MVELFRSIGFGRGGVWAQEQHLDTLQLLDRLRYTEVHHWSCRLRNDPLTTMYWDVWDCWDRRSNPKSMKRSIWRRPTIAIMGLGGSVVVFLSFCSNRCSFSLLLLLLVAIVTPLLSLCSVTTAVTPSWLLCVMVCCWMRIDRSLPDFFLSYFFLFLPFFPGARLLKLTR